MPAGAVPFPFGKCRICKDKATGIHYGVATCEGCKGFFKRSTVKGEKYKCFFGGQCEVTPKNRNRCKSCRFKLCLTMGMSVEAVKMGRIPKVEKEKALRASFKESDLTDGNGAVRSSSTKVACGDLFNVKKETDARPHCKQAHEQREWYDQGVSTQIVGTGSQRMGTFPAETISCSQQIIEPNVISQITDNVLRHMNIDESMIGCSSEQVMRKTSPQVCTGSQLRKVVGNQHLIEPEEHQNSSSGLEVQALDSLITGKHLSNTISASSSANVVLHQDQMHEFANEGQGQNRITGMKSHAGNGMDSIFQDNQSSNMMNTKITGNVFVKIENNSSKNIVYQRNQNVSSSENREIHSDPIRVKTELKSNDLNHPSTSCERRLITKCVESDDCLKDYDAESADLIRNTTKRFEKAFEALYDDVTMVKRQQIKEYFENKRTMRHTLTDAEEVKFVWGLLLKAITGSVNSRIVSFCGEVPGFINVCPADRAKLSKRAYLEIWLLTAAEFFQGNESYLIIGDGVFYSRATMCVIMNEIIVDKMFDFAEKLNEFRLTDFEIAILCAIQLTTADQLVLDELEAITELNSHYLDILAFVVNKNRPIKGSRLLIDLFRLIPKLVEISKINAKILEKSSLEGPIADQESCRCVLDAD